MQKIGVWIGFVIWASFLAATMDIVWLARHNPYLLGLVLVMSTLIYGAFIRMAQGWHRKNGILTNVSLKKMILGISGGTLAFVVLRLVEMAFIQYTNFPIGTPGNEALVERFLNQTEQLYPLLYIVLLGPVVEEYVFRVLYYDLFYVAEKSILNVQNVMVITVNAIIWTLVHANGFDLVAGFYFGTGLIFSVAYLKTRNILVPMGVHVFHNTASMLFF